LRKNKFTITKECFEIIYSQFEGHTWYVQAVLNAYSVVQVSLLRAIAKDKVVAQIN